MTELGSDQTRKQIGRRILIGVTAATAIALLLVTLDTERNPRTDDASVRANFIAIAPEVSGRLAQLPVKDNAFVKQGDLLFVIDPRDYEYALRQALSDQENLEQRIIDTKRKIAAQNSAVEAEPPQCMTPRQQLRPQEVGSIWLRLLWSAPRRRSPPPRPS